jgi:hypothetical protein
VQYLWHGYQHSPLKRSYLRTNPHGATCQCLISLPAVDCRVLCAPPPGRSSCCVIIVIILTSPCSSLYCTFHTVHHHSVFTSFLSVSLLPLLVSVAFPVLPLWRLICVHGATVSERMGDTEVTLHTFQTLTVAVRACVRRRPRCACSVIQRCVPPYGLVCLRCGPTWRGAAQCACTGPTGPTHSLLTRAILVSSLLSSVQLSRYCSSLLVLRAVSPRQLSRDSQDAWP